MQPSANQVRQGAAATDLRLASPAGAMELLPFPLADLHTGNIWGAASPTHRRRLAARITAALSCGRTEAAEAGVESPAPPGGAWRPSVEDRPHRSARGPGPREGRGRRLAGARAGEAVSLSAWLGRCCHILGRALVCAPTPPSGGTVRTALAAGRPPTVVLGRAPTAVTAGGDPGSIDILRFLADRLCRDSARWWCFSAAPQAPEPCSLRRGARNCASLPAKSD
jgi:hypothetical protein